MSKALLICLIAALCSVHGNLWAQNRTISGRVTSEENGSGLPGVNVVVKGTTIGTVTDVSGNYSVSVPDNASALVFTFIGLVSQEVEIGGRTVIDVEMAQDVQQLTEVVVVAYGEETKRNLTSSVSSVDSDLISRQQVVDVGRALQGTVPGVNIITGSGQPGANPQIRVRGIPSINVSAEPLIVLDGAVYNGNLNTIDQNEIESISVLKDAAAAALYGARAGAGVILLTSKRGKAGATRVNLVASSGVSERAVKEYPFINAQQQMQLEWETLYNDELAAGNPDPGQAASDGLLDRVKYNPYGGLTSPIGPDGELVPGATLQWETDWEDALLQRGSRRDVNLNVSGGTDAVTYFFGASYLKQDGIVIGSDFERFSGRLNLDAKLNTWLSAGIRQSLSTSSSNFPTQSGTSFANAVQYIRSMPSIYPIYLRNVDGSLVLDSEGNPIFDDGQNGDQAINTDRPTLQPSNAVAQTTLDRNVERRFFTTSQAFLEATFLKDFRAKSSFTLNKYIYENPSYTNPTIGSARTVNGRINDTRNFTTEWTLTNSLNWNKTLAEVHRLEVLLLQEAYEFTLSTLEVGKTGLPFPGLYQLNSAATLEQIDGGRSQERLGSLMARVSYDFKDRYLFQASVRRDLSSRFLPDTREGIFYSLSGSWIVSDEEFFSNQNVLSFLKLRASYGEVGNSFVFLRVAGVDEQQYFPAENVFETGFDQLSTAGIYIGSLRNARLTWETSAITNVAVDFGFLNDKITGSIDAYIKATKGLILARPLSNSLGARGNSILENSGNLKNEGIEVALNYNAIQKSDFTLSIGANMAFERNEITEWPEDETIFGNFKRKEGGGVYDFFIREWAGVDSETGAPLWYRNTLNEAGEIVGRETTTDQAAAQTDRIFAGSALPWGRGGFNFRLTYKGFDLSSLLNFSVGGQLLDLDYAGLMEGGLREGYQKHTDILDRWRNPGDITDVPRLNSSDQGALTSTRFLRDATYARLRNVTLGYSLPKSVLNRTGVIQNLRIFVQGDNLITFFKYDGLDPEQNINGETNNRSSIFKTITGGIEMTF